MFLNMPDVFAVQTYPSDIGVFENVWCNERDFDHIYIVFQPINVSIDCNEEFDSISNTISGMCDKIGLVVMC